jgi:RNA polymerase sigma factor (sigma-70 family)
MNKEFDGLDTYIHLAKKTISKFGPKFYNGLSAEMLKNSDAISDVATAIMYADWRFDPERKGKSGQQKTLYSYRNQCAIWAIKTYVTNKYKKRKDMSLDFDKEDSSYNLNSTIVDHKNPSPLDILLDKERASNISDNINALLNTTDISDKQRDQIKMYYFQNETLSAIGEKYGVSREAVRQNIKRGIDIIRQYDEVST